MRREPVTWFFFSGLRHRHERPEASSSPRRAVCSSSRRFNAGISGMDREAFLRAGEARLVLMSGEKSRARSHSLSSPSAHRGHSPCTIYSLAFNRAGSRLAASSDKGTVHVFHLPSSPSSTTSSPAPPPLRPPRSDQSKKSQDPASSSHQMPLSFRARGTSGGLFSGNFPSSLSTSSSELMTKFLPSNSLSETVEGIEGIRSFAQARVKEDWNRESGKWKRQVCALVPGRRGAGGEGEGAIKEGKETDEEFLIVLTAEGLFYRFELDVRRGGNCRLLDEKTLLQEEAASQAGAPRLLGGKTG